MTDLQDEILDRLVGTTIGVNWPDGPLAIAAEVIGGTKPVRFGQTDNDRGAKSEIARRLGYPILLVEAIQGGNRALSQEHDRRTFAMGVFRLIPIGGKPRRLSALEQNRIAGQMAIRAHTYLCTTSCDVPQTLHRLLEANQVTQNLVRAAQDAHCQAAGEKVGQAARAWLTARSNRMQRLLQTAEQVIRGMAENKSLGSWCSIRESVRLAAAERGIEEAIACCVEIARLAGLVSASR